jgi:hypothetical protein
MSSVKCLKCGLVNWATASTCKKCGASIAESVENRVFKADGANGQLEMTKTSIIIKRNGLISFLSQGLKGDKEILISQISSIEFKPANGILNGYIQLSFIGGQESKGSFFDVSNDENTVMFESSQQPAFEAFKRELQERMRAASGGASSKSSYSNLDELEKLAALRDKNIISSEEFESKKHQLLGL